MDHFSLFTPLFVYTCAMISPGQNFLIVTYTSINTNQSLGCFTACGVATGSFIYACISMFAATILATQHALLYQGVCYFSAAYLTYLGGKIFLSSNAFNGDLVGELKISLWSSYLKGLLTNLANPKTILFFLSIFTLYLPTQITLEQKLIEVSSVLLLSLLWHNLLASLFVNNKLRSRYIQFKPVVDKVVGVLFVFFGLSLFVIVPNKLI